MEINTEHTNPWTENQPIRLPAGRTGIPEKLHGFGSRPP